MSNRESAQRSLLDPDEAVSERTSSRNGPLVTVVVPTLDEDAFIVSCLGSLLKQEGLPGGLEILVVDGGSRDRTRELVGQLADRDRRVRLIDNPDRIQTAAFNLGLDEARGEYIAFVGAHATYDRRYLAGCLEVARGTGATNVGAVQTPVGQSPTGRAVAWAMSSPLGVGGASFRYAQEETSVRSVFGGFLRVEDLRNLGGFRNEYRANEDYELNCRIRRRGGTVVASPRIRCKYYVRETLGGLARQLFRYGKWRVKTVTDHPDSLLLRHVAASLLPVMLFAATAGGMTVPSWAEWLAVPGLYGLLLLVGAVDALRRTRDPTVALRAPGVLATMHLSWGIGWWAGVLRFGFPWLAFGTALGRVVRLLTSWTESEM